MKYKLINQKTKEEHLCDKVTIDGFDYYVNEDVSLFKDGQTFITKENIIHTTYGWNFGDKVIICTNNPNIDIPKVADEIDTMREILVDSYLEKIKDVTKRFFWKVGFKHGYNKSQETHPFSEEDMIDFAVFYEKYQGKSLEYWGKDLFKLWKEQQPKIIYYNE